MGAREEKRKGSKESICEPRDKEGKKEPLAKMAEVMSELEKLGRRKAWALG